MSTSGGSASVSERWSLRNIIEGVAITVMSAGILYLIVATSGIENIQYRIGRIEDKVDSIEVKDNTEFREIRDSLTGLETSAQLIQKDIEVVKTEIQRLDNHHKPNNINADISTALK